MSSCELGAKSMALSYLSDLKTCGTSMGFCRVAMFGMFTLILRTNEKWIPTYCTVTNPKHQWSTRFGPGQIPSDSHICSSSVHLALPVVFLWSDDPCDVTTYLQKRARQWPSAHTVLSYVYTESNTCFRRWDAGCWKSWSVAPSCWTPKRWPSRVAYRNSIISFLSPPVLEAIMVSILNDKPSGKAMVSAMVSGKWSALW